MEEQDKTLLIEVQGTSDDNGIGGPVVHIKDDQDLIAAVNTINQSTSLSASRQKKSVSYVEIDSDEDVQGDDDDDLYVPVLPDTISFPKFPKTQKKSQLRYKTKEADGYFHCSESGCEYKTKVKCDLYKHVRCHSLEKAHVCPVEGCDFRTNHPHNIKHHMVRHQTDRPFSCNICKATFKKLCALKNHLLVHSEEKPIKCPKCEFRCKRNWELKSHMLIHSDVKAYTCEICGHSTKAKSDLTKHMKNKHVKGEPVPCPFCSKPFDLPRSLKKHIERLHSGPREGLQCPKCDKVLSNRASLRTHDKIVHQKILPHTCKVCNKNFGNKSNLQKHSVTHDESRKFVCEKCPFRAIHEDALRAHIGVEHGGEATQFNNCDTCGCSFRHKHQYEQHLKTDKHTLNEQLKADGKEHMIKKGTHMRKLPRRFILSVAKSQELKKKYAKQVRRKRRQPKPTLPQRISNRPRREKKRVIKKRLTVKLKAKKSNAVQVNQKKVNPQKKDSTKKKSPKRRSVKSKKPMPLIEFVRGDEEAFLYNAAESGGSLSQIAGACVKEEPVDYTQKLSFFNLRDIVTYYNNHKV